jgi:DNA-binding response OmpR family regulator
MADILVVEDEAAIQVLIRIVLESAGYSVDEARDGGAALDLLYTHSKSFELILLDLLMPKVDGFEVLSKLQNHPFRPPVIVLTAHPDSIPKELEYIISRHVLKPFRRQELSAVVNSLLSERIKPLSSLEMHGIAASGAD